MPDRIGACGVRVVPDFPDRLLKPGDAAERLALSTRSLDNLHAAGLLPKIHVLGSVRFRLSDVERIIREGATAPDRRAA